MKNNNRVFNQHSLSKESKDKLSHNKSQGKGKEAANIPSTQEISPS